MPPGTFPREVYSAGLPSGRSCAPAAGLGLYLTKLTSLPVNYHYPACRTCSRSTFAHPVSTPGKRSPTYLAAECAGPCLGHRWSHWSTRPRRKRWVRRSRRRTAWPNRPPRRNGLVHRHLRQQGHHRKCVLGDVAGPDGMPDRHGAALLPIRGGKHTRSASEDETESD